MPLMLFVIAVAVLCCSQSSRETDVLFVMLKFCRRASHRGEDSILDNTESTPVTNQEM